MRVPGVVFASDEILRAADRDQALQQVMNVATLPGIVKASMAMPDIHWGYGFPMGGVAAMRLDDGVVSPGGVGFDINCGVRLLVTDLSREESRLHTEALLQELMRRIPQGTNDRGALRLGQDELRRLVEQGVPWLAARGWATDDDVRCTEEHGVMAGASAEAVSARAFQRGHTQVGSLGAGNHFIEVQAVSDILDERIAAVWGLRVGQVTVMIHSGSRGFGHQICTDHLQHMATATRRYGYELPDRQLACAPASSPEGQAYMAAMAAAANFAFANRQVMTHEVRLAFEQVFHSSWERLGVRLLYDVAHNIAKQEEHEVDGLSKVSEDPAERQRGENASGTAGRRIVRLLVHRKGATRAFGPGRPELPQRYRDTGQPVIIPGDMGRESWLLVGTDVAMRESFGSACHGAGRLMSRTAARKVMSGAQVREDLERRGISVRSQSTSLLAEEAPYAYKDVGTVVDVVHDIGLARKVARLVPLAVLKG